MKKLNLLISAILFTAATSTVAISSPLKLGKTLSSNYDYSETDLVPAHSFKRTGPTIQIALLLDTSNSMDGLINQAKTKLWDIVNELGDANLHNDNVTIQVALMEYGKNTIPQEEGYMRIVSHLSNDLDIVSSKLFSLNTSGGDEYAGTAINTAINRLQWSTHPDDLKIVIIAGNESFQQGNVSYQYAINKAVKSGAIVNTIFCGDRREGEQLHWKDGAKLGNGKYLHINIDQEIVHIVTPYDDRILRLNVQLNNTYIGYGSKGKERMKVQEEQDMAAQSLAPSVAVSRAVTKSSSQYNNESWDMVDALKSKKIRLDTLSEDELPEGMADMSIEQRAEFLKEVHDKREDIQDEIRSLEQQRKDYIARNKMDQQKTLDDEIINSVKSQAKAKGYKFK